MSAGKLIVFSAPSGSGKTTLVQHVLSQDLPLGFSISATSRPPRGKEQNGREYYFLSSSEFKQKIQENAFLEYEEVYQDTFYGTLVSEINRLWAAGKHVLFDIDVVGGLNIKKKYSKETLAVFVKPPSLSALEERLRKRATDGEEKIKERLAKAESEMLYAPQFDYCLVNDDLEVAKKEVVQLVTNFINS
ncbi:MAG: guanylate kinase [Bacteroidetes bacterium]|nr:guanylate kinase [Bacteroidota bacterium]MDA0984247.1 guanylate kinase [Bacteroidota bacterium]